MNPREKLWRWNYRLVPLWPSSYFVSSFSIDTAVTIVLKTTTPLYSTMTWGEFLHSFLVGVLVGVVSFILVLKTFVVAGLRICEQNGKHNKAWWSFRSLSNSNDRQPVISRVLKSFTIVATHIVLVRSLPCRIPKWFKQIVAVYDKRKGLLGVSESSSPSEATVILETKRRVIRGDKWLADFIPWAYVLIATPTSWQLGVVAC